MKVLLACPGIYQGIGSAQRFYEHLIGANPSIDFYFAGERPPAGGVPNNAHYLPLADIHRRQLAECREERAGAVAAGDRLWRHADEFMPLLDFAASIPAMRFDILDIPDSLPFAVYLPAWLRECGVGFGKVALSLQGAASMRWHEAAEDGDGDGAALRQHEELLYRSSDIRYGMVRQYLADWQRIAGLPAQLIDTDAIFAPRDEPAVAAIEASAGEPPSLCFIGMPDKAGGSDLFFELSSRLPRDLFTDLKILCSPPVDGDRLTELRRIAHHRSLELIDEAVAPAELARRLRDERIVAVLPSRGDPFNFLAVEALLNGCPSVISIRSGAADALDAAYPGLAYVKLDPDNLFGCYDEIVALLTGYDAARAALRGRLAAADATSSGAGLGEIYAGDSEVDHAARVSVAERFSALAAQVAAVLVAPAEQSAAATGPSFLAPAGDADRAGTDFSQALGLIGLWRETRPLSEDAAWTAVDGAIDQVRLHAAGVNRVHLYRLLAQWERARGNDLLYAAYCLRVLRLGGRLPSDTLREATGILIGEGLVDAAAAAAMLQRDGEDEIAEWLDARQRALMAQPACGPDEFVEVNRPAAAKISVIVAVCNAGHQIERFAADLARLTEDERAICEFIVIDRASVDDSAGLIEDRLRQSGARPIGGLVLRCAERETLGQAWNRGIAVARGGYVTCLGVDQMLRPGSLAALATCLDHRGDVDWAQGNAVTVEVDRSGVYRRDVAASRRDVGGRYACHLDPDCIGHLGALYRKSLHDRAGYYDPSSRTAASGEFTNRAAPFMRVETVPRALGTHCDYPDDQTQAAGAIAEIEALGGWHLHRTVGGIRHAFAGAEAEDCVAQFRRALHFRRPDRAEPLSDVEYAWNMAEYLRRHRPETFAAIEHMLPRLVGLRVAFRRLDDLADPETNPGLKGVVAVSQSLQRAAAQIAAASVAHEHDPLNSRPGRDHRWRHDKTVWLTAARVPGTALGADGSEGALQIDLSRPIGGAGWYPPEGIDGHWHRWTGPDPEFILDLLLPHQRSYRGEVLLAPIRPEVAAGLSLTVNGTTIAHVEEWAGEALTLSFPVMRTLDRSGCGAYRVVFRHQAVFRPSDDGGSGELRRLGFAVSSIRFLPLPRKPVDEAPANATDRPSPLAEAIDAGAGDGDLAAPATPASPVD